ncbi:MAG: TIGR04282 family arsenosugar biosynthesis glycosyltransferase [Planctomycetota bacterium]
MPVIPLLLFAKAPRPGRVKTRIGEIIGKRRAALLADSLERLLGWGRAPVVLLGDTEEARPFARFLRLGPLEYRYQGEGSLGARLLRAFRASFDAGFPAAMAVGADTPHLPTERLDEAVDALSSGEAALGPARDGGYYLIGLVRGPAQLEALFPDEGWGGAEVLQRTRDRLRRQGVPCRELAAFWDVDQVEDLVQLWEECSPGCSAAEGPARTLRVVERLLRRALIGPVGGGESPPESPADGR